MQKRTFVPFAKSLLMEKESIPSVIPVIKKPDSSIIQEEAFAFFHKWANRRIRQYLLQVR
jgi:hypothetical protein